jgi:hypothetical protein
MYKTFSILDIYKTKIVIMSCRSMFPTHNVPRRTYPNVHGVAVPLTNPMSTGSNRSRPRYVLRRMWNGTNANLSNLALGGFRAVNNAGDPLSRKNYSCGGPNPLSSRPGIPNVTTRDGPPGRSGCDGTGVAASTCNVKYVYDSSDFIKFRKQRALNRSYDDYSSGGGNKSSQVAFRRARIL